MFWNALISRAECFWTRSCKSLIRSHHCRHRDLDDVIAILMTSSRLFHPFQRQEIPQRRLKRKRKHNLEVVLWVCRIRVEGFFRYKSQTRFKRNFFSPRSSSSPWSSSLQNVKRDLSSLHQSCVFSRNFPHFSFFWSESQLLLQKHLGRKITPAMRWVILQHQLSRPSCI